MISELSAVLLGTIRIVSSPAIKADKILPTVSLVWRANELISNRMKLGCILLLE
jgi:hypothetical protein